MVRALATGDVVMKDWFKLLGRECLVALGLGITMAIAVAILGYIRGDAMVASARDLLRLWMRRTDADLLPIYARYLENADPRPYRWLGAGSPYGPRLR